MEKNSWFGGLAKLLVESLRTFSRFLVDAVKSLGQHWPQLVALFLAGWAGRMGFLWLATIVSDYSPTVAILILPLAPLTTLLSLVLMMRALSPTLPAFQDLIEVRSNRKRWSEDLATAGKVLLPFLAVYASAGLLKQDVQIFLLDSAADESYNTTIQNIDWGRANYAPGWTVIIFIVVALVARKVLAILNLTQKNIGWAALAAYFEVLWIMTLANSLTVQINSITEWITSRQVIASIIGWWNGFIENVREFSQLAGAAIDGIISVLGNLEAIVVIPVAWLAIGAAVYGQKLQSTDFGLATSEQVTKHIKQVPNPVRRAARQIAEPISTPIENTISAIRQIAVAGILPMVMFCVVFFVATGVQTAIALGLRYLAGPGPAIRQFALEPYAMLVERCAYFVLLICLLGAAVNAIVSAQKDLLATSEITEEDVQENLVTA